MTRLEVAKILMNAAATLTDEYKEVQRMVAIISSAVLLKDEGFLWEEVFQFKESRLGKIKDEEKLIQQMSYRESEE